VRYFHEFGEFVDDREIVLDVGAAQLFDEKAKGLVENLGFDSSARPPLARRSAFQQR